MTKFEEVACHQLVTAGFVLEPSAPSPPVKNLGVHALRQQISFTEKLRKALREVPVTIRVTIAVL